MTSPQDPNRPVEPGAPAPGDAAPQGWGQPPAAGQPGWGAPPPAAGQPGWGAPPPAAGQPGWGAPPPGGQPAWGQPQPGWGQPPKKKGHGCLIAFLIVLAVVVLGVGGCTLLALPYIQTDVKLQQDLQGKVTSVSFDNTNGTVKWVIHLNANNSSPSDAAILACTVVRPDLQGTQFANSDFELVDSDGFSVADNHTPCP
jgi:hypothetical protein